MEINIYDLVSIYLVLFIINPFRNEIRYKWALSHLYLVCFIQVQLTIKTKTDKLVYSFFFFLVLIVFVFVPAKLTTFWWAHSHICVCVLLFYKTSRGYLTSKHNYPSIDCYCIQGDSSPLLPVHYSCHYLCLSHILSFSYRLCAVNAKEV